MSIKKLTRTSRKSRLVTGGSRRPGPADRREPGEMARGLRASPARKADELEEEREHLARQIIEALPLPCDLSQPEAIAPMLSKVLRAFRQGPTSWSTRGRHLGRSRRDHRSKLAELVNLI